MLLKVIPGSNYCEKALWMLKDVKVVNYSPLFHYVGTHFNSVPYLQLDDGNILKDSKEITKYVYDKGATWLYPNDKVVDLEKSMDDTFGVHTRRVVYYHMLLKMDNALIQKVLYKDSYWLTTYCFFMVKRILIHGLKINEERMLHSMKRIYTWFEKIEGILEKDRFLYNKDISAADITFAAHASLVLMPKEHPVLGDFYDLNGFNDEFKKQIFKLRDTKAGQFALDVYKNHRN